MTKLATIEGIGPVYSYKLHEAGINSIESLLKMGRSRIGRNKLAKLASVNKKLLLKWINHADLMRVKGVGEEYSDLLEATGVDTVVELSHRNPEHLFKKIQLTNKIKHLVRRIPSFRQVQSWVRRANKLPRVVTY